MKLHFISGLPRSGSTLLAALLCQNPRFVAGVTSPLAMLCGNLLHSMSGATEFVPFFDDDRRRTIIHAVFAAYYPGRPENQVIFDTNRSWTARTAFLSDIYPDTRLICCVRDVAWILDSMERLFRRNPLQLSKILNYNPAGSIYSRVETLMDSEKGLIGLAWSSLREAWFGDSARRLIVIRYDSLTRAPQEVLSRLYEELGEVPFSHDCENVSFEEPTYDIQLGTPGLHRIRPRVEYKERDTCIPPDIFLKICRRKFLVESQTQRQESAGFVTKLISAP